MTEVWEKQKQQKNDPCLLIDYHNVFKMCFGYFQINHPIQQKENSFFKMNANEKSNQINFYMYIVDMITFCIEHKNYKNCKHIIQYFYKTMEINHICNHIEQSKHKTNFSHSVSKKIECIASLISNLIKIHCSKSKYSHFDLMKSTLFDIFICLTSIHCEINCSVNQNKYFQSHFETVYLSLEKIQNIEIKQTNQLKFKTRYQCILKSYLEWSFQKIVFYKKNPIVENPTLTPFQNNMHYQKQESNTLLYLRLFISIWDHPFNVPSIFCQSRFKELSLQKISKNIKSIDQMIGCHDYDHIIKNLCVEYYIDNCIVFISRIKKIPIETKELKKLIALIIEMIDFLNKWNNEMKIDVSKDIKSQNRCYCLFSLIYKLPVQYQQNIRKHVKNSMIEKIAKKQQENMKSSFFFSRKKTNISDACNSENKSILTPTTETRYDFLKTENMDVVAMDNENNVDIAIEKNLFFIELVDYMMNTKLMNQKSSFRNQKNNSSEKHVFNVKFLIAECTCKMEMFEMD